jgi:hypothetical protein
MKLVFGRVKIKVPLTDPKAKSGGRGIEALS